MALLERRHLGVRAVRSKPLQSTASYLVSKVPMRIVWLLVAALAVTLNTGVGAIDPKPQTAGSGVVAGQVVDAPTGTAWGAVVTLAIAAGADPGDPRMRRSRRPLSAGAWPSPMRKAGSCSATFGSAFVMTATLEGFAPGMSGRRRPGGPGQAFQLADAARVTNVRSTCGSSPRSRIRSRRSRRSRGGPGHERPSCRPEWRAARTDVQWRRGDRRSRLLPGVQSDAGICTSWASAEVGTRFLSLRPTNTAPR